MDDGVTFPLDWGSLTLWCVGICFFGVFFAVPLRVQTILKEKLRFPSGLATARVIAVLHNVPCADDTDVVAECNDGGGLRASRTWRLRFLSMVLALLVSSAYTLAAFFVKGLQDVPVLSWLGAPIGTMWHWTLRPSPSYIGQGMIMGLRTGLSMLLGAIVAWAVLGPLAVHNEWVTGATLSEAINDGKHGAKGWILWISLSLLLADSLISLAFVSYRALRKVHMPAASIAALLRLGRAERTDDSAPLAEQSVEVHAAQELVPRMWWVGGLVCSAVLCAATISPLYGLPWWQPFVAVAVGLLVSVLAVRALGETDLNPVSL